MLDLLAFVLVFGVIAGFEFIDRTNFALISLAARERPLSVWFGAALAFLATTVISVGIGGVFVEFLWPQRIYVRLAGGLLLLAYAGYLLIVPETHRRVRAGRSALTTAFLLIFFLEIADTTMILTINFVATYGDPLLVGFAAAAGLLTVAATACLLGPRIGARVEPALLERIVVVVLVAVGILTVLYAVDPGAFPALE